MPILAITGNLPPANRRMATTVLTRQAEDSLNKMSGAMNVSSADEVSKEALDAKPRKLDSIQEGERTLLDNSVLLFCSSMLTGSHDATQLPVVVLGGGGGRIKGGRVLDYKDKPNRQMCRLYLSLMDKFDYHPGNYGDATAPLEEV